MPNISRGQLAVKWFETRHERKKEAPQEALTRLPSSRKGHSLRYWTPQEDEVVRASYLWMDGDSLAQRLGRTVASLRERARVLGVVRKIT